MKRPVKGRPLYRLRAECDLFNEDMLLRVRCKVAACGVEYLRGVREYQRVRCDACGGAAYAVIVRKESDEA